MIVVVGVQGDQMNYMIDGCDGATAVKMLTACAQAITERMAAEGAPAQAPAATPPVPRPRIYLPNGHIPPPMAPGQ